MKNRAAVSIFAAVAAVAFALWLLWSTRDEPSLATPPLEPPRTTTANDASLQTSETTRIVDTTATTDRSAAAPREPVVAPLPDDRRLLRGTIVVIDEQGVEHSQTNGSIVVEQIPPDVPEASMLERATVTNGQWETSALLNATRLSVSEIVLDGRLARCKDSVAVPPYGPVALRAQFAPFMHLRVVASDTGDDLVDLRVVQPRSWELDLCDHPGNRSIETLVERGASPLRISPWRERDEDRFWVHSPGYAWGRIQMATAERGERTLTLQPGGDIDVTVLGAPPAGSVLRARPADGGSPAAEFALHGSKLRVDALPVGRWTLTIELGKSYHEPMEVGTTTVDVTRGTIGTASITVVAAERPPLVALRGTLRMDPAWGKPPAIELTPAGALRAWSELSVSIDAGKMTAIGDGQFRWGPIDVLAGQYGILVPSAGCRMLAEVGPRATTEIDIVVPPPQPVRVRLLEEATGAPIVDSPPSWYCGMPAGWSGGWSHMESEPKGDGWYEFSAPTGKVSIHVGNDDYVSVTQECDVPSGGTTMEIRLRRDCGIEIVFTDNGVVLPWPDHVASDLTNAAGKSAAVYWQGNKIGASEPGEHVLDLRGLEGYEPVPPRKVVVRAGEWTKVEIALKRKS